MFNSSYLVLQRRYFAKPLNVGFSCSYLYINTTCKLNYLCNKYVGGSLASKTQMFDIGKIFLFAFVAKECHRK